MARAHQAELARVPPRIPAQKVAPFAVNQIIHQSNDRLEHDLDVCMRHRGADHHHQLARAQRRGAARARLRRHRLPRRDQRAPRAKGAGSRRRRPDPGLRRRRRPCGHAEPVRAGRRGAPLLRRAASCCPARSPAARGILAAQAMGADLAYIGTRFIATQRSAAPRTLQGDDRGIDRRRHRLHALFSGVHGNYLKPQHRRRRASIPTTCPPADKNTMNFGSQGDEGEGLAGHLGRRPGRRQHRGDHAGARGRRQTARRVRERKTGAVCAGLDTGRAG